jgi:hypothetical protein
MKRASSVLAFKQLADVVGNAQRLLLFRVDEHDFGRAIGVQLAVYVHFVERGHARSPRRAREHLHLDRAGIVDRLPEVARGIDDHDADRRPGIAARQQRLEPADARLLHVAEVDRVVDVAHRVHVAPADVDALHMHQFFFFHKTNKL